jgi:Flp pilus assembly pilin Flp
MSYVKLRSFIWWLCGPGPRENGQALAEFTFIVAFVALVCVLTLTALGLAVTGLFEAVLPGFGG